MANITSWFQRLVPLSTEAAQAAAEAAAQVATDADKERREQQQVASADAAKVSNQSKS